MNNTDNFIYLSKYSKWPRAETYIKLVKLYNLIERKQSQDHFDSVDVWDFAFSFSLHYFMLGCYLGQFWQSAFKCSITFGIDIAVLASSLLGIYF